MRQAQSLQTNYLIYFGLALIHKIPLIKSLLFIALFLTYPENNHSIETLNLGKRMVPA